MTAPDGDKRGDAAPDVDALEAAGKPLTALEWLRVTHAGTLSGRRIEEAVAAAEALGRAEAVRERDALRAAVEGLAAEWAPGRPIRGTYAANRLHALLAAVDGGQ